MISELALVLSLVALVVAGVALVQALAAQRRVDVHKAHLAQYMNDVDKRLTAPPPDIEALCRRAVDATLERGTAEEDVRRVALEFARLADQADNGERDWTDAQLRVAIGAELQRRRG